ncbi:MAG: PPC domain-containing protein [Candidatus Thiodiazotropha taylori]|nr:PPC domain-containing protein [Candidatus Thiodiazotropha taylori]MCG8096861.1 PPC domain-containing protein [Candidatus Thiodiazotropha endolucinida]MCG8072532.1 PPC domain-containing protein [Candidatus Thiodiazotropha taylori]MCG8108775.1 PPC domain-containing protein [Candidatus Thiodiazotropha taylori]MCG8109468.1 PPC domain-containing protein [Candidatus Thiodiazotropha taylori]
MKSSGLVDLLFSKSHILLLVLIIALTGCGSSDTSSSGGGGGGTSPPPPSNSDTDGNTSINSSRTISLNSSGSGSYSASLRNSSDRDYYRINISVAGEYVISSSGSTDTVGRLLDSNGNTIAVNDDGGSGNNFRITRNITSTGTYYIRISAGSSSGGSYTITISRSGSGGGDGDAGQDVGGRGDISWTLTWSYTGSETTEGPDIDLWVLHPNGTRISGVNRSGSNMRLDVDDLGGFGSGNGGGPERIYFTGSITLGSYDYGLRWYRGRSGSISYRLRLYDGQRIVGEDTGRISAPSSAPGPWVKVSDVTID